MVCLLTLAPQRTAISASPLSADAFSSRLRVHLQALGMWAREMSHSVKRGAIQEAGAAGALAFNNSNNSKLPLLRCWVASYLDPGHHLVPQF